MLEDFKTVSSTEKDIQKFSRMVGSVLLLIGMFSFFLGGAHFGYFFIAGGVLVVAGEFTPQTIKPLQRMWMMLSVVLGVFMTRIILALLFYVVITPLALLMRIFGKQFLDLEWKFVESYWIPRPAEQKPKESYTQQF